MQFLMGAMMTKAKLIHLLQSKGYGTVADYIRHERLPGMVFCSFNEIKMHCYNHGLRTAGDLIQVYEDEKYD